MIGVMSPRFLSLRKPWHTRTQLPRILTHFHFVAKHIRFTDGAKAVTILSEPWLSFQIHAKSILLWGDGRNRAQSFMNAGVTVIAAPKVQSTLR